MARRSALVYDQDRLTEDLKVSAGRGVGALFPASSPEAAAEAAAPSPPPTEIASSESSKVTKAGVPVSPGEQERNVPSPSRATRVETRASSPTVTPTPGHPDTVTPRRRGVVARATVRAIRKAVLQVGKEAATHRFTVAEKEALAEIVYTYRRQGIRTSENELVRIGVHRLVDDYRQNGPRSVLQRVLRALKA